MLKEFYRIHRDIRRFNAETIAEYLGLVERVAE